MSPGAQAMYLCISSRHASPEPQKEKQAYITAKSGVFVTHISTVIVSVTQVMMRNTNICTVTLCESRLASAIGLKKTTRYTFETYPPHVYHKECPC